MSLRKHDLQRRQSEYSLRASYLKPVFCVVCYRPIDALSSPYDPGCGHIGHEDCFRQVVLYYVFIRRFIFVES